MTTPALAAWLPASGPLTVRLLAYASALLLTLALAAWLTPRRWWRRPTVRGAAVLAGGTLAFGALFLALAGRPGAATAAAVPMRAPAAHPQDTGPTAGAAYRVVEPLNLRAGRGVHTARLAALPAGSLVVASGARDGDWWEVRVRIGGRELAGWTSSLWLRRAEEIR